MTMIFSHYIHITVFVSREVARNAAPMTSFSVITTCASQLSGYVMAKRTARWARTKETAREQVQKQTNYDRIRG